MKNRSVEPRLLRVSVAIAFFWLIYRHAKYEETLSLVIFVFWFIFFILNILLTNRVITSREKSDAESVVVSKHNLQLLQQLGQLDMETRRELGAWLHSTVQPKLLSTARKAWSLHNDESDEIAAEIDALNEDVVRRYSHDLFPIQLEIALALALADLLFERATFTFDKRMFPVMDVALERLPVPDMQTVNRKSLLAENQVFFPIKQRYAIYRIVEEAVSNAEKKASTTEITVDISIPDEHIIINVIDNGEPVSDLPAPGLGMRLIDSFTLLHGGSWNISNIPEGVQFQCIFPVISEFIE